MCTPQMLSPGYQRYLCAILARSGRLVQNTTACLLLFCFAVMAGALDAQGATTVTFEGLASSGYPGTRIAAANAWTPSISGYVFSTTSANGLSITTWGNGTNSLYKQDWDAPPVVMQAADGSLFTISKFDVSLGWGYPLNVTITGYNASNAVVLTQSWTNLSAATTLTVTNSSTQVKRLEFTAPNSAGGPPAIDNIIVGAAVTAPAAPTNLTASAGNAQVTLSWAASTGATSYNVYRGTSAGGESTTPIVTGITTTSYTNTGLTNGTTYYYKVAAVNAGGTSPMSNEASARPAAPSGPITFEGLASSAYPGTQIAATGAWTPSIGGYVFSTTSPNGLSITTWGNNTNSLYKQDWDAPPVVMQAADGSLFTISKFDVSLGWGYPLNVTITGYNASNAVVLTQSWTNINAATTLTVTNSTTQVKRLEFTAPSSAGGPPAIDNIYVSGSVSQAPPAPTGLTATAGNAQVALSWAASAGATSYNVYRGTSSNGESTTPIATGITATSYTNTGLTNGTTYYFKVAAVNASGTSGYSNEASATPQASGGTVTSASLNGMNIGNCTDWETNRMFVDVMKTSRTWQTTGGTDLTPSQLDSNGWPNQDAKIVVWAGIGNMHGTYALSFNGQATISGATITGQSYNSSTNTTTATLTFSDSNPSDSYLGLQFTSTKKTSTSATNTGISNVVLRRPTSPGSSTPYASNVVFTTQFLNAMTKYSTLRFMDYLATNSNPQVNWSDRTLPTQASFQIGNPRIAAGGWEGRGGSWEHIVLMANASGKDIWIDIPCQATDDYITKVAQLLRYGSDGVNPYTSTQASPVWPALNGTSKVYVEFSNEVWNTAGAFQQSFQNYNAAQANKSPMNFDGTTNDWYLAWRRTAVRTVQISNLFRSVWGDANMMTRIRPVLESQLGYADGPGLQGMLMMESYYNNSSYVTTPRHPSYYLYGWGGSAYYNCDSAATTADQVLNTMPTAGFATAVQADTNYAKGFGLQHTSYEGGPSLDKTGNATYDNACDAAWRDSRMAGRTQLGFDTFQQNGGDLLMHFTIVGDHQWGFTPDILTTSFPKLSGIDLINAESTRPAATYGTAVPATLTGNSFKAPPSWQYSNTNMTNKAWVLYIFRVTSARSFSITASTSGSGTAEICVDQTNLGTFTAGSGIAAGSITLQPGIHGIKVKAMSGTFTVNSVGVN